MLLFFRRGILLCLLLLAGAVFTTAVGCVADERDSEERAVAKGSSVASAASMRRVPSATASWGVPAKGGLAVNVVRGDAGPGVLFETIRLGAVSLHTSEVIHQSHQAAVTTAWTQLPGVTEIVKRHPRGVEQSWRFDRAPADGGDLVVAIAVSEVSSAQPTPRGYRFVHRSQRFAVEVHPATWVDARGERAPVAMDFKGGVLSLRVPGAVVARSEFPAVLDPVIETEILLGRTDVAPALAQTQYDVASDGTDYLVGWVDRRDGQPRSYVARVDASGQLVDSVAIPFSNTVGGSRMRLAFDGTNYVVMSGRLVRHFSPNGAWVDDVASIPGDDEYSLRRLAAGGGNYLLLEERQVPTLPDPQRWLLVDGATNSIITTGDFDTSGSITFGDGRFFISRVRTALPTSVSVRIGTLDPSDGTYATFRTFSLPLAHATARRALLSGGSDGLNLAYGNGFGAASLYRFDYADGSTMSGPEPVPGSVGFLANAYLASSTTSALLAYSDSGTPTALLFDGGTPVAVPLPNSFVPAGGANGWLLESLEPELEHTSISLAGVLGAASPTARAALSATDADVAAGADKFLVTWRDGAHNVGDPTASALEVFSDGTIGTPVPLGVSAGRNAATWDGARWVIVVAGQYTIVVPGPPNVITVHALASGASATTFLRDVDVNRVEEMELWSDGSGKVGLATFESPGGCATGLTCSGDVRISPDFLTTMNPPIDYPVTSPFGFSVANCGAGDALLGLSNASAIFQTLALTPPLETTLTVALQSAAAAPTEVALASGPAIGEAMAVWVDRREGGRKLFGAVISCAQPQVPPQGALPGGAPLVADLAVRNPRIAKISNKGYVVAFAGSRAEEPSEIYVSWLDETGNPKDASATVVTASDWGSDLLDPSVSALPTGEALVSYSRFDETLQAYRVGVRVVRSGLELGESCGMDADCHSRHCVDGVCCSDVCGTCETCDADGACAAVVSRSDDTCFGNVTCDAGGVCLGANATACGSNEDCASGVCQDELCVDRQCQEACEFVDRSTGLCQVLACGPYTCRTDDEGEATCNTSCEDSSVCTAGHQCQASTSTCLPVEPTPPVEVDGGCGCHVPRTNDDRHHWRWILAAAAAAIALVRRRRPPVVRVSSGSA